MGRNDAIKSCFDLFLTHIDAVLNLVATRAQDHEYASHPFVLTDHRYILIDTPGQLEIFLWSSSGQNLLNRLSSQYPVLLTYVLDIPQSSYPVMFMSNMLYAHSILSNSSLPAILVCNKTDVEDASFVREWINDFDAFQNAVENERIAVLGEADIGGLMGSMGVVLEEFRLKLDVYPNLDN
jgi:GPN-loop GTPase